MYVRVVCMLKVIVFTFFCLSLGQEKNGSGTVQIATLILRVPPVVGAEISPACFEIK